MEIAYTEEQQALKSELRAYYQNLLTPELEQELSQAGGIGPVVRKVVKQMGSDGWLGIGWPTEWGGQGRSAIEQFIFFDESMRSGAPVPMLTINTVGPTIMNFGTQEQKEFFLPKILAGEIHFCIGYTEPNSGTDLASLTTRAVRDGDEYVINGAKIFTSLAGDADYIWLATRTDPNVAKHKGISMFVVPMDTPGIRVVPDEAPRRPQHQLHVLRGRARPGHQPGRWREPGLEPDHQPAQPRAGHAVLARDHRARADRRAGLGPGDEAARRPARRSTRSGCRSTWPGCTPSSSSSASSTGRWPGRATQGHLDVADASSIKVFGTEFYLRAFRSLMEIIGQAGYLTRGSPGRGDRRAARDVRPLHDHPHLRRRHQRDPAGPHRHLRPRHAAVAALSPRRTRRDPWTSTTAKSRRPSASWPGRSSASGRPTSG